MDKLSKIFLFTVIGLALIFNSTVLAVDEGYRLNVDDKLHISVWGHEDLEQEINVGPNGTILFPLVGELDAANKRVDELKAELATELKEYIKLEARYLNIAVLEYKRNQVSIAGEIRQPGRYQLQAGYRVLDAISQAGNETREADLANVTLTRNGEKQRLDLKAYLAGEAVDANKELKDGDLIRVPRNTIEVTIIGEVRNSGNYKLETGKKITDLIANAGGLTSTAGSRVTYLTAEGEQKLKTEDILSGGEEYNLALEENAIVRVKKTRFSWERFFFFVGGLDSLKGLLGF